jgi:hypothetical protein
MDVHYRHLGQSFAWITVQPKSAWKLQRSPNLTGVELIAGAHAGRSKLGEAYLFHDVSDAALQALASGGDPHDALVVHLVEVPIELGDDLIAAQLPFAALLGGVSDRYRSLHGLIVGDQRGLSAAYGRLAGRLAPAIAPRKR